jgi:hypothetical protein
VVRDGVDPSTSGFSDQYSIPVARLCPGTTRPNRVAPLWFVERVLNSTFTVSSRVSTPVDLASSAFIRAPVRDTRGSQALAQLVMPRSSPVLGHAVGCFRVVSDLGPDTLFL